MHEGEEFTNIFAGKQKILWKYFELEEWRGWKINIFLVRMSHPTDFPKRIAFLSVWQLKVDKHCLIQFLAVDWLPTLTVKSSLHSKLVWSQSREKSIKSFLNSARNCGTLRNKFFFFLFPSRFACIFFFFVGLSFIVHLRSA